MDGMLGPTLQHYEIIERLDAGGMGEVYHARDTRLGRSVALKILPAALAADPDRLARFEREAKALAALSHPNIVTIYSIEEADGVRFLAMELVSGDPLSRLIPPFGWPLPRLLELCLPLADALGAAHQRGVIHRDLKPANIMLSDEGRLKVLDFGLAKLQQPAGDSDVTDLHTVSVTQQGLILGTVPYMSPEQAQGRVLDHRSDLFSFGIILYEMACGRRPFQGESPIEVLSAILKETPRPIRELVPALPAHLEEIVERCLEKDPARRFQSAAELRGELEALQRDGSGSPVRSFSLHFPLPPQAGIEGEQRALAAPDPGPGARWLRCDLRVRTPAEPERFLEACQAKGIELLALADPNSIEGWCRLRTFFEAAPITVLPGLELAAGQEAPVRFLAIFPAATDPAQLEALLGHLFAGREPFDAEGRPCPAAESVDALLERMYEFCRPPEGDRHVPFVLLLLAAGGSPPPRPGPSRSWHGVVAADWRGDGPSLEASDPERGDLVGTAFTWIKLELADLEGVRLALVDPESRLRPRAAGPPGQSHPHLRRMVLRKTDFFEELDLHFSPCLTTLIGGRGSGKSTVIECLRFALDRARPADFQENEGPVREAVEAFRSGRKRARDFGETPGVFLPGSEIELEAIVAGKAYRVLWLVGEAQPRVVPALGAGAAGTSGLDIRALLAPRILSQGQIAQIARDPSAQRRELDALLDREALRQFEDRRRALEDEMSRLQLRRQKLEERQASLPARETELRRVRDQIELLERGGNRETLELYEAVQAEKTWLEGLGKALETACREVRRAAESAKRVLEPLGEPPAGPARAWAEQLLRQGREGVGEAARALEKQVKSLETLREGLRQERNTLWRPVARQVKARYAELRREMEGKGVDFAQHAKMLEQRGQLEREVAELSSIAVEVGRVRGALAEARAKLVGLGRERLERRRALAQALVEQDADVRMEVVGFGDRREVLAQRERWFGGTGLREQDWELLVEHLFTGVGEGVPERLLGLVEALTEDVRRTRQGGGALDVQSSEVALRLGDERAPRLSRHFFKALQQGDRIRLEEMERYLPEDQVETRVRAADGTFRPVTQGSVGQRSTAVLSLLLSAGDQPLIIDQPEDDLDNQYVYSAVVGLLRRQKFARQIVIATHNANIPVNGDAELIVALGVRGEERLGGVLAAGSIDRPEVKAQVSAIMEGSAEAFRLRRERYGY